MCLSRSVDIYADKKDVLCSQCKYVFFVSERRIHKFLYLEHIYDLTQQVMQCYRPFWNPRGISSVCFVLHYVMQWRKVRLKIVGISKSCIIIRVKKVPPFRTLTKFQIRKFQLRKFQLVLKWMLGYRIGVEIKWFSKSINLQSSKLFILFVFEIQFL